MTIVRGRVQNYDVIFLPMDEGAYTDAWQTTSYA
jgi:hypothetical protein